MNRSIFPQSAQLRITTYAPTVVIGSAQSPSVIVQAVVTYGSKVQEGVVITALRPAWKAIVALMTRDPNLMFRIDPRKWEEIIAAAYDEAGFDEVILTPQSGDLGRDVIATKRGHFQVRFIDQVKAYKPGHKVDANDVRAMLGVLSADSKANKGIVTTTSEFAPKIESDLLLAPFIPNRLELVDGKKLITKLDDIANGG